jgi:hypothetical protein
MAAITDATKRVPPKYFSINLTTGYPFTEITRSITEDHRSSRMYEIKRAFFNNQKKLQEKPSRIKEKIMIHMKPQIGKKKFILTLC